MPGDGTGRIINISGTASTIVWAPALTHGLNNAAMNQATGYLATDLAGQQITVNTVVPGLVGTEGREVWAENMAKQQNVTKEEFLAELLQADGDPRRPLGDDGRGGGHGGVPRLRSRALLQRREDHHGWRFERERTTRVIAVRPAIGRPTKFVQRRRSCKPPAHRAAPGGRPGPENSANSGHLRGFPLLAPTTSFAARRWHVSRPQRTSMDPAIARTPHRPRSRLRMDLDSAG